VVLARLPGSAGRACRLASGRRLALGLQIRGWFEDRGEARPL